MDVQLTIPFETLVELVEQLPEGQQQALIQRLQAHTKDQPTSAAEKIARLRSAQIAVTVNQEPSIRREDWYDDAR